MKTLKSMTLIGAALASAMACYTVSLRVSAERAAVERTRGRIAADIADIRLLQAELRTRARLPELQRWNEQVLALAPPKAEQFLGGTVQLASYAAVPTAPAAAQVAQVAVAHVPAAVPMAAPSPVHQIAYVKPAPAAPAPAIVASSEPRRERAAAAHAEPATTHRDAPRSFALDRGLTEAIAAAAAAERSGFQKIALR